MADHGDDSDNDYDGDDSDNDAVGDACVIDCDYYHYYHHQGIIAVAISVRSR